MSESKPLWTQDQAIAFEAALEAINDVIAGTVRTSNTPGTLLRRWSSGLPG
jgi:hypothetical protein